MIHTNRTVTVGNQESIIDSPIILYRGDRDVEVEFTLNGNKFMFTNSGNVIKSANATLGQLVINTPSGENMFSAVSECHDGRVVFIITKEMIDELIEIGFYSFQIRLFDDTQASRVTIPPIYQGIEIRNPIAAEDETSVVDMGLVDLAIVKATVFEDLSTFLPNGNYNKTDWQSRDVISQSRLNKIEDALYQINENMEATDLSLLNRLDSINQNVNKQMTDFTKQANADMEDFERSINNQVGQFKVDANATMSQHKNEVAEELTGMKNEMDDFIEEINEREDRTTFVLNNEKWGVYDGFINPIDTTNGINNAIRYAKDNGYSKIVFEQGEYLIQCDDNTSNYTTPFGGIVLQSDMEYDLNGATFKIIDNDYLGYSIFRIENISNVVVKNGILVGDRPRHNYTNKSGTHEFGYGVFIRGGQNIDVLNNIMYDFTGDCICIMCSQKWDNASKKNILDRNSERVNVLGNDLSHSRRQGISVCSAEDINIKNNVIHHIGITEDGVAGTAPQFGIDLEGYTEMEFINRCLIENNHFNDNLRADIYCASRVDHVVIRNNICIRRPEDVYVNAIGDGGGLANDNATKHCIIDGNYIERGGIKAGAWQTYVTNNVVRCIDSSSYGIDVRYHSIKDGEGGIVNISNNQVENGAIQIMHCNLANINNNIISHRGGAIDFGISHNQLSNITMNTPSKSCIVGNTIIGDFSNPITVYSNDPTICLASDCMIDITGKMPTCYTKNSVIKLTLTGDCRETYRPILLDNCVIYYNGYRIIYPFTNTECIISNCSFYNTDNTKKSNIMAYGNNPPFTITNNYFYNCNDTVPLVRSKSKCILVNNFFEKASTALKNVINNPWDATGNEVSIYKNNVVVNFNEVNK